MAKSIFQFEGALASSFLEIGELAIFGYCNYSE